MSTESRTVERVARAIYLQMHGRDGGLWEAVETKEVWHDLARQALKSAFDFADDEDWRRLFGMIDDSAHGRFWKAVMCEIQDVAN
jgi:cation transport regulator ChaB